MQVVWQQLQSLWWLAGSVALVVFAALCSWALRALHRRRKQQQQQRQLRDWLEQDLTPPHQLLHDLTLALPGGGAMHLDHVVVAPAGIFVLQTQHMQGAIWGAEHQHTWTQSHAHQRHSFPNPLRQRTRTQQALYELLSLTPEQLHVLVVFPSGCTLQAGMPAWVTAGRDALRYVQQRQTPVWPDTMVLAIAQQLQQLALPHQAARRLRSQEPSAMHMPPAGTRKPVRPLHPAPDLERSAKQAAARLRASFPAAATTATAAEPAQTPQALTAPALAPSAMQVLPAAPDTPPAADTEAQWPPLDHALADNALRNVWHQLSHHQAMASVPAAAAASASEAPWPNLLPCPQCSAPTVPRSLLEPGGSTRYFARCSRYPDCRFIRASTQPAAAAEAHPA